MHRLQHRSSLRVFRLGVHLLDSFACPHWSSYQGYQFWGPISHQTMWSGANYYLVFSYWVYDSSRQVFQGNSACWYLANVIFRGCFWF